MPEELSGRIKLTLFFKPGCLASTNMEFARDGLTNEEWSDKFKLIGGADEFILTDREGTYRYAVSNVTAVSIKDVWTVGERPTMKEFNA